jgi:serine/threonine-protein kinase
MKRNPVTHREYMAFLDERWAAGDEAAVEAHMPGAADMHDGGQIKALYRRDESGRHALVEPGRDADEPVSRVEWPSARAYAAWVAQRTGRPWRLPSEWEYEKAARGVDGRRHPWGDHFEPCLTHVANSQPVVRGPVPVQTPTADVSVYGIRWLAGNMRTWCQEAWSLDGPPDGSRIRTTDVAVDEHASHYIERGAAYCSPARTVSSAARTADPPGHRMTTVGLRLVYGYPMEADDGIDPQ